MAKGEADVIVFILLLPAIGVAEAVVFCWMVRRPENGSEGCFELSIIRYPKSEAVSKKNPEVKNTHRRRRFRRASIRFQTFAAGRICSSSAFSWRNRSKLSCVLSFFIVS